MMVALLIPGRVVAVEVPKPNNEGVVKLVITAVTDRSGGARQCAEG